MVHIQICINVSKGNMDIHTLRQGKGGNVKNEFLIPPEKIIFYFGHTNSKVWSERKVVGSICKIPGHTLKCFKKKFGRYFEVTSTYRYDTTCIQQHTIVTTLLRLCFYFHFSSMPFPFIYMMRMYSERAEYVPLEMGWVEWLAGGGLLLDEEYLLFILNVFKHNKDSIWDGCILQIHWPPNFSMDFIM